MNQVKLEKIRIHNLWKPGALTIIKIQQFDNCQHDKNKYLSCRSDGRNPGC